MQPETKGIAGHEGAGVVVSVGDNMHQKWKVGDRAGVKWVHSICGACEFCTNGTAELHCPNQKISAVTVPGTFQQYVVADGNYTSRLPEGVEDEEAGPVCILVAKGLCHSSTCLMLCLSLRLSDCCKDHVCWGHCVYCLQTKLGPTRSVDRNSRSGWRPGSVRRTVC